MIIFIYFSIGVLIAAALGFIEDINAFCDLMIVLIGWPICLIAATLVALVCEGADLYESIRRTRK